MAQAQTWNSMSFFFFNIEQFVYAVCVFMCWAEIYTKLSMQKTEDFGSDHSDSIQLSEQNCFLSENKYSGNAYWLFLFPNK